MSLNQKYTWHDFLKAHPEHREKKLKRTSPEGKKAFEIAFKQHAKTYLTERSEKIGTSRVRTEKRRDSYVLALKDLQKSGKKTRARLAQERIGRADAYIARMKRFEEATKALQKKIK